MKKIVFLAIPFVFLFVQTQPHARKLKYIEIAEKGGGNACELLEAVAQDRKYDIHATNDDGQNALHVAVINGHFKVAKWLVEHWAKMDAPDVNGLTPVHHAVAKQDKKMLEMMLLQERNKSWVRALSLKEYQHKRTPLHMTCSLKGDIVELVELVANGADGIEGSDPFGQIDTTGCSPIHLAAWRGNAKTVAYLVKAFDEKLKGKETALALLEAVVNEQTARKGVVFDESQQALHTAVINGLHDVAEWLIDHGAKMNKQDAHKLTPVHHATANQDIQMLKIMFAHKNDPTWKLALLLREGKYNRTPLHIACNLEDDNAELVRLIAGCSDKISSCSLFGFYDSYGCSPLQLAAWRRNEKVVRCLVNEFNMKPTCKGGEYNITPLMMAVAGGNKNIIQFFLENGADEGINQFDAQHRTLQDFLSKDNTEQNDEILHILEKHGFDPNTAEKEMKTQATKLKKKKRRNSIGKGLLLATGIGGIYLAARAWRRRAGRDAEPKQSKQEFERELDQLMSSVHDQPCQAGTTQHKK